ncbi:MAG: carbonic anhydrase [Ignavibacteriales bacterium]
MKKRQTIISVRLLAFITCIFLSSSLFGQSAGEQSLSKLLEGNKRYLSGQQKDKNYEKERAELATGQKPYAIILTCSDSRVPPEIIFDEDLGELFVIRVAGNVIDEVTLGSIEYAAEHLNSPLLVVMGHSNCGAVKACLEGGHFSANISAIVTRIKHATDLAQKDSKEKAGQLDSAVKHNVVDQLKDCLMNSKIVEELEHEGKLKIVGGVYNIETGAFELVE